MAGTAAAAEPDEAAASGRLGGEGLPLDAVFRGVEPSSLAAVQPFVSWHGVLVWAFAGWGPSLWAAKHALNDSALLGKEAYGSRWPKVTLGCLDDGADLTRPEFEALRALCHRHRLDRPTALRLDEPRCVLYANRALEKLLLSTLLPAAAARAADAGPEPPAPESAAMVEEILAEMDGGDYWHSYIRGDGGVRPNRASHYRGLANGTTVVQFLGSKANAAAGGQLLQRIAEFRKAVDDALPGKYCWFQDDALHVTIRGCCP